MKADDAGRPRWWARGLLFENCCCTAVCPGHVHFEQACTYERCVGYWAIRFDEGDFAGVALGGLTAVIAYETPRHMIEGDWTQALIIDERAGEAEREAIRTILDGRAGGPWAVLARFVARRLEPRYLPIAVEDRGKSKRVVVPGLLDSTIEAIRSRDKAGVVTFENMFNQIHAASQVIAKGDAHYDDGTIVFDTASSHALYSDFRWSA